MPRPGISTTPPAATRRARLLEGGCELSSCADTCADASSGWLGDSVTRWDARVARLMPRGGALEAAGGDPAPDAPLSFDAPLSVDASDVPGCALRTWRRRSVIRANVLSHPACGHAWGLRTAAEEWTSMWLRKSSDRANRLPVDTADPAVVSRRSVRSLRVPCRVGELQVTATSTHRIRRTRSAAAARRREWCACDAANSS